MFKDYTKTEQEKGTDFLIGKTILVYIDTQLKEYEVFDATDVAGAIFIKEKSDASVWTHIPRVDIKKYKDKKPEQIGEVGQKLQDYFGKKLNWDEHQRPYRDDPYYKPAPYILPQAPIRPYAPNIWCEKECSKCGLKVGNTMGYVCPNSNCPTGLGPIMCRTSDSNIVEGKF